MPLGKNYEHVTVRLIDYEDLDQKLYVVTTSTPFALG